jgi:hypothetical protein
MEKFSISTFLEGFDKTTSRGKCKSCSKLVPWSRDKVASHKRSNCVGLSNEERLIFVKRSHNESQLNSQNGDGSGGSSQCLETEAMAKLRKDAAVGNFFLRTGISFRVADSQAFKDMVFCLDPSYNPPSSRTLSGRLLDKQYEEALIKVEEIFNDSQNLTLTSDGWTNVRQDHMVNFIVKAPSAPPFFYKCINTSGIPQTKEAVAGAICEVIETIGPEKFNAVVTDNAPNMRASWKIIMNRYPWISAYGCAAHGVNLVIKDITELPENSITIRDASKIIQFISNHTIVRFKFDEKRAEAGVDHKLSSPVSTRWYSQYTSARSLLDSKVAVKRLENEHLKDFLNIMPKHKSKAALSLMKSEEFWERLEILVNKLEMPSKIIGEKSCLRRRMNNNFQFLNRQT